MSYQMNITAPVMRESRRTTQTSSQCGHSQELMDQRWKKITPQKDEELKFTTAAPQLQTKMLRLRVNGSDQAEEQAG